MISRRKTAVDPSGNITYGRLEREEFTVFITDPSIKQPITIETIGITHPDPKYYIERKHNDYYIFEYVLNGKGHIENDGKFFDVEAGDVYILEPGVRHRYYSDSKDPFEKIWINVFGDIIGTILKEYNLSGKTVFKNCGCQAYFNQLLHIANTSNYSNEICYEISAVLFQIMCHLAEKISTNTRASEIAKETRLHLDNALYSKITIEEISEKLHISKAQLIREFNKHYGITPYQYLLDKKMKIAEKLLETTNLSVYEISDALSFADEHYFSDIFKRKVGTSPLKYRKNSRT